MRESTCVHNVSFEICTIKLNWANNTNWDRCLPKTHSLENMFTENKLFIVYALYRNIYVVCFAVKGYV